FTSLIVFQSSFVSLSRNALGGSSPVSPLNSLDQLSGISLSSFFPARVARAMVQTLGTLARVYPPPPNSRNRPSHSSCARLCISETTSSYVFVVSRRWARRSFAWPSAPHWTRIISGRNFLTISGISLRNAFRYASSPVQGRGGLFSLRPFASFFRMSSGNVVPGRLVF